MTIEIHIPQLDSLTEALNRIAAGLGSGATLAPEQQEAEVMTNFKRHIKSWTEPMTFEQFRERAILLVGQELANKYYPSAATLPPEINAAPAEPVKRPRKPREAPPITPAPPMTSPDSVRQTDDPKEVEEKLGRRVELSKGEEAMRATAQAATHGPQPTPSSPTGITWTVPLLKSTFVDPISVTKEMKVDDPEEHARRSAILLEIVEARKQVDPNAQQLITVNESKFDALAAAWTEVLTRHGVAVVLPSGEGVEA